MTAAPHDIQPGTEPPVDVQIATARYALFRLLRSDASFEKCQDAWRKIEALCQPQGVDTREAVACKNCNDTKQALYFSEQAQAHEMRTCHMCRPPASQGADTREAVIEAGAQALANDVWHPPQLLKNLSNSEANKFRRQAGLVLDAALRCSTATEGARHD